MSTPPPPPSYPQGGYGPPQGPQGPHGPQPGPPPAPSGKVRLRGRIPLRLSLILGVIGVALGVVGVVLIATSPISEINDFPRADINQTQRIEIDETGGQVVYFETPSNGRHTGYVQVRVLGPDGRPVDLARYGNTLTYDVDGRFGEALFTFDAPSAGTYTLQSQSRDAPSGAQVAVGGSVAGGIVTGVLLFIPGLLLVIAAVVLLIVGLVKRSRHKRELASGYVGGHGPNYYTGQ